MLDSGENKGPGEALGLVRAIRPFTNGTSNPESLSWKSLSLFMGKACLSQCSCFFHTHLWLEIEWAHILKEDGLGGNWLQGGGWNHLQRTCKMQRDPLELREKPDGIKSFCQNLASSSKRSGHTSHLRDENGARPTQIRNLKSLQNQLHPNKGYLYLDSSNHLFKISD